MSTTPIYRDPRLSASGSLRVSRYEQVASWLVSFLVMVGLCALCLIIMWFTSRMHVSIPAVAVQIADVGGGSETGVVGESMQLDAPNAEQVAKETDLTQQNFPESVAAIAEAVASRQAQLADLNQTGETASKGGGKQQGTGTRPGYGYGDGPVGIPRANRWEIRFDEAKSIDDYAQQLDFFGIELGLIGSTQEVHYLHHVSQKTPQVRTGQRQNEDRLYMSWRRGTLFEADRDLARRAGLSPNDKVIVQFFPPDVENQLAQLEIKHANRKPEQIRKTIFGVRRQGKAFAFHVIDQSALAPR